MVSESEPAAAAARGDPSLKYSQAGSAIQSSAEPKTVPENHCDPLEKNPLIEGDQRGLLC